MIIVKNMVGQVYQLKTIIFVIGVVIKSGNLNKVSHFLPSLKSWVSVVKIYEENRKAHKQN